MTDPVPPKSVFSPASEDAATARQATSSPQTEHPAYRLAFQDQDFLLRQDLRPIRFQLELLKPELLLDEANIESTFVFYGSARIPEPDKADALIARIKELHSYDIPAIVVWPIERLPADFGDWVEENVR